MLPLPDTGGSLKPLDPSPPVTTPEALSSGLNRSEEGTEVDRLTGSWVEGGPSPADDVLRGRGPGDSLLLRESLGAVGEVNGSTLVFTG